MRLVCIDKTTLKCPSFKKILRSRKGPPTAKITSPHSISVVAGLAEPTETTAGPLTVSPPKRVHAQAFPDVHGKHLNASSPPPPRRSPEDGQWVEQAAHVSYGVNDDGIGCTLRKLEDKKPTKMRSSLACVRCRKSKVKCVNVGTNVPCRSCATSGRECVYPAPTSQILSSPKRVSDGLAAIKMDIESDVKRAKKREIDASKTHSIRTGEDPLESPAISSRIWNDIYSLFMLHCSTELPFLHQETFHSCVRQPAGSRSSETKLFLLGILTLTARFVPELVSHHDPADPLAASEFYAQACAARLTFDVMTVSLPSLECLQTLLMLSFYHWGQWRGSQSWAIHWNCCRMVATLKLASESVPAEQGAPSKLSILTQYPESQFRGSPTKPKTDNQHRIAEEIKRRTLYSLFILDRHFSAGHGRTQLFPMDKFSVQLPYSENFRYGSDIKTSSLQDSMNALERGSHRRLVAKDEDPTQLSVYIQLVEIWGRLSAWLCRGGRRASNVQPWDKSSEAFQLRSLLESFQASLDPRLTFTTTNLFAQIGEKTLPLYASIHVLYYTCTIALHREYIPHIPLRCQRPSGPLDPPLIIEDTAHEGYFARSAELLFQAARNIMSIAYITSCHSVFVESPTVVFGLWSAAFTGLYSKHFPHMDPQTQHSGTLGIENFDGSDPWVRSLDLTHKILKQVMPKIKMARYWKSYLDKMERKYAAIHEEYGGIDTALPTQNDVYEKRIFNNHSPQALKESADRLEEHKIVKKPFRNLRPNPEDYSADHQVTPVVSDAWDSPISRSSSNTPFLKMEATSARDRNTIKVLRGTESSWAAVNNSHSNYSQSCSKSPSDDSRPNINCPTIYPHNASIVMAPALSSFTQQDASVNTYCGGSPHGLERGEQHYHNSEKIDLDDLKIDSFNTGVMVDHFITREFAGPQRLAHGLHLDSELGASFDREPTAMEY